MTIFSTQPDAAAGKDTRIWRLDPAQCGGTDNVFVGDRGNNERGLLEFDCSSIDAAEPCNSATLYLYHYSQLSAAAFTINLYSIAVGNAAWIEGASANPAAAGHPCWNGLAADGAWGVTTAWAGSSGLKTSVTDYEAAAIGSFSGDKSDAEGVEYAIALDVSRVEGWFGGTNTNYGILIVPTEDATTGGFCTSEHATAAYRPKLVIDHGAAASVTFMRAPFWGRR